MRGGGSRTLTPDQLDQMCRMRERGRNPDQIAAHFAEHGVEISPSAIAWQCLTHGADAPAHLRGRTPVRVESYWRNGHLVRPYTPDEDARLRALAEAGTRKKDMAALLGRKSHSIIGRLLTLARQDARREESGQ